MTALDETPIRLTGPEDVLDALPVLLGFTPVESLTVIALNGSRVAFAARIDVDAPAEDLNALVGPILRTGAQACIVCVFSRDPVAGGALPHAVKVDFLEAVLARSDVVVLGALLSTGERWWSYGAGEQDPEGAALNTTAVSPLRAAAAYRGQVTFASRQEAMASLGTPSNSERQAAMSAALDAARDRLTGRTEHAMIRSIYAAARKLDSDPTARLSAQEVAELAVSLENVTVRDAVWLGIERKAVTGRALWRELFGRVPAPLDAAALFLYGWESWRKGEGPIAVECVTRALDSDPTYSAAVLLDQALREGLSPFNTPRLRK